MERKKRWFGPRLRGDHGSIGVWLGYNMAPKSWEGWALIAAYFLGLTLLVLFMPKDIDRNLYAASVAFSVVVWHMSLLWLASRNYAEGP